jgi:hypothetical protein
VTAIQLAEFWGEISGSAFTRSALESSIRDPLLRYIHRVIACTFLGRRHSTEKCSALDLLCLRSIVRAEEPNLACLLLASFDRSRRAGTDSRLALGPYVTRIAQHLGVLQRYPIEYLTPGPPCGRFGIDEMRLAGMLTYQGPLAWVQLPPVMGPQVVPPPGTDAEAAMQQVVPPQRQRILPAHQRQHADHPRRQPPPAPVTLEGLRDQVFTAIEELRQGQLRQDRVLRIILTQLGLPIPDFFVEPPPPQPQPQQQHPEQPADVQPPPAPEE